MPRLKIDSQKVARRWKARGFGFGIFTDPPGQVWKDYVHPTDELLMAAKGVMKLEMKDRAIRCKIGKEILIPAKTKHTVRNVGKTESLWFYGYKQR